MPPDEMRSLCVNIDVFICLYRCMYMYMYICIYVYMYTIDTYLHIHISIYAYIHIYIHAHIYIFLAWAPKLGNCQGSGALCGVGCCCVLKARCQPQAPAYRRGLNTYQ